MKILLVFVVAAVLSGLSEGSNITRCELKSQLNITAIPLPQVKLAGLTPMDLVARLVCHVERSTGFNTSTVTEVTIEMDENPPKRGKRGAEGKGGPRGGMGAPAGGHSDPAGGHNDPAGGHNGPAGGYNGSTVGHNNPAGGHNDPTGGHNSHAGGHNGSTVTEMSENHGNPPKRGRRGAEGKGGRKGGMGAPAGGHNGPAGGHNGPAGGHSNPGGGYNGSAVGHNDPAGGHNGHAGGHNGSTVTEMSENHGNPPKRGRRGAEGKGGPKGGMGAPAGGHNGPAGGHNGPAGGHNDTAGGHNDTAGGHSNPTGGYNGSAVGHNDPPKRGRRGAEGKGGPKGGMGAPAAGHKGPDGGKKTSESSEEEKQVVWRLYGLFQLSDHVICSDGVTPSANICNMKCTDLLDNDVTDDIACLETIKAKLQTGPGNKDLMRMVNLLNMKECVNVKASNYFASC